jgi:hypothetical protein
LHLKQVITHKSTNVKPKKPKIMNSKVKVTADETTGLVVNVSKNNPEWGHIRVQQSRTMIDDNGFVRKRNISSLIHGTVEDLKSFKWVDGQEVPGKIIAKESLEPFNFNQPERDYKIAGKTGIVCCQDGQPIYRKTFYTLNSSAEDVLVAHNNIEDIRAAYSTEQEVEVDGNVADL